MIALSLRYGRPPKELLETIGAKWLHVIWAYHKISPIDDSRGDLRAGIVASTVARCAGNKDAAPLDFMPFTSKGMTEEQRFEQFASMLEQSRG